jgi:hypothetical protein
VSFSSFMGDDLNSAASSFTGAEPLLIIRKAQMAELETWKRSNFLNEMVSVLRAYSGGLSDDPPDFVVRREIEILADQAVGYGLASMESTGLFLVVCSLMGWDFPEVYSFAGDILQSDDLDEEDKRCWLEQWFRAVSAAEDRAIPSGVVQVLGGRA